MKIFQHHNVYMIAGKFGFDIGLLDNLNNRQISLSLRVD
jgi:hypothetical protein